MRPYYWTQVPRFMRMWADHLHKWPKDKQPTASVDRSQDPPGSWRSDSNVVLSPENHARTKDAVSGLRRAEPRVTGDLQNVIRDSPFGPELVGLESRNKGEDRLKEKVAEFNDRFASPFVAAERGFVDDVIEPHETRPKIIKALRMLETKVDTMPKKKHSNIPL